MTVGISAALANSQLDAELGTSYIQVHTGDPGAAGTANVASTTRTQLTYASASGGSKILSVSGVFGAWADGNKTLTHVSVWSAASGGTLKRTAELTAPVAITDGQVLTIDTATAAYTPVAA